MLPSGILYYVFDLLYIICFPINGHEFESSGDGERQEAGMPQSMGSHRT